MTVRVALIGAGSMGADHARIIAQDLPGATLQVVCDASAGRARQVAEATGAVDVASDPFAAIERSDVDAVLVASPDETHAALCLAAIAARKPVLCEKPLAVTVAECMEVVEAEVAAGERLVQVGFMRRFEPAYVEMREAVAGRTIGRALMMHNAHRNVEAPAGFTGKMAITNSAPHEFDIARFVLGSEATAISVFQPGIRDTTPSVAPVFIIMETSDGQIVDIEVNNNAGYGYDVRCELVGETGSIAMVPPAQVRLSAGLRAAEAYPADWRPRFAEAYRLQDKAWIEAIRTGVPSAVGASAWDGLRATAIAEAGVRALGEGAKVTLPELTVPDLYRRERAGPGASGP